MGATVRFLRFRLFMAFRLQALAGASQDLRRSSADALYRHHALSALFATGRAPWCTAADRRKIWRSPAGGTWANSWEPWQHPRLPGFL